MSEESVSLEDRLKSELAPQFEVVRLLGEGKAARVFLAREGELRRLVAIKVPRAELARDEVARLRFAREGQSAARISHPNVTAVYQVGKLSDDTPYLVMEHVEGGSLEERVEAVGPFPADQARVVIHGIASALAAAHRRGIIHRDVRPSNVLWKAETRQALLTDFGLAAVEPTGDQTTRHLTRTGEVVMGDVTFVSPEQLMGESVSGASDMYSLGGLAWFLLTGDGPFQGRSAVDIASKHLKAPPPDLAHIGGVPNSLAQLVHRCLSKNPSHRPTAEDVAKVTATEGAADVEAPALGLGLFQALGKRRFIQVVGAYTVFGWIVLQVVDQFGQNGVVPHPVSYHVTLGLFIVGFAAAGVWAWYHGEKGRQEVSKPELALLSIIAVVAILVTWFIAT